MQGLPVPNLEDPAAPLQQIGQTPAPACFAPIAPSWLPRRSYAGTYDEAGIQVTSNGGTPCGSCRQVLAEFGLDEHDVAAARVDDRWRGFMRFQIARARRLYTEAMPGIALLHPDGRFAVTAAAMLYKGILDDIETHDFNVFDRRAHVTRGRKMALLLHAFRYAKRNQLLKLNQHSGGLT